MMKKAIGVISAAVLVLALQAQVQAQGLDLRVGATANLGTSNDFGVGPRVELDLDDYVPGLRLAADYHKYFDSQVYSDVDGLAVESSSWDAGFHILYDIATIAIAEGATLYAGAGVLYAKRHYDHWLKPALEELPADEVVNRYGKLQKLQDQYLSDSGASVALTVGSTFNTGWTVIPFVEARYTIGVVDELMVAAGILFSTGLGSD
jgi:hypothetical protein